MLFLRALAQNEMLTTCDGKIIKIPRREFIFRTCEDGVVWHLIPRRISPCSESFLGYIYELAYYVGVNLGLE